MKFIRILLLIFLLLGVQNIVFSAAPPPPPTGTEPSCWPPPCIPIDGGVSFLIAAGAAYGAKKLYDKKKSASKSIE